MTTSLHIAAHYDYPSCRTYTGSARLRQQFQSKLSSDTITKHSAEIAFPNYHSENSMRMQGIKRKTYAPDEQSVIYLDGPENKDIGTD